MSWWSKPELTNGFRPVYQSDETELVVQNNVGIYEGKIKALAFQNGRIYLTSHRIFYIDARDPQASSLVLPLAAVEGVEFYSGFMRSSPKITLQIKARAQTSSTKSSGDSTPRVDSLSKKLMVTEVTWICPICFFSNTLPEDFPTDRAVHAPGQMPVCATCGIKATQDLIEESIKNSITLPSLNASTSTPPATSSTPEIQTDSANGSVEGGGVACPRCTFVNHPSMNFCEICGSRIVSPNLPPQLNTILRQSLNSTSLTESSSSSSLASLASQDSVNYVPETDDDGYLKSLVPGKRQPGQPVSYKLSFRSLGAKSVYEQLKVALDKRAWAAKSLLSKSTTPSTTTATEVNKSNSIVVGIHGLQLVGEQQRAQNQQVLGSALEDLTTLMARAQEVVKLAENYSKYLEKQESTSDSATANEAREARRALQYSTQAMGFQTTGTLVTKDKFGSSDDEKLYHEELARQLAEFLADTKSGEQGVLSREGGIITLFDLFAVYNRARGVSLVSPRDLLGACNLLSSLQLPITLRTFNSGLQVVQEAYRTEQVIIRNLVDLVGRPAFAKTGASAINVSNKFKWSVMIATEELEMAEQRGVFCRDEQPSGTTFYVNQIPDTAWNWKSEIFGE